MRITHNQITKQLIADIKVISKSDLSPELKEKLITGKITALSNGWMTIDTESASLVVKNAQTHTMMLGDHVTIELLGKDSDGQLMGKLIAPENEKTDDATLTKLYAEKLNLLPTERNMAIIEALVKEDIPVTQNTVHLLQQSQVEVKTLVNELSKMTTEQANHLLSKLDEPIKGIVLELIKQSNPISIPLPLQAEKTPEPTELLKNVVTKESGLLPIFTQLAQLENTGESKPIEQILKEVVSEFDLTMDVTRFKNELDLTLKNMMQIHNLFTQNVRVEDAFQKAALLMKEVPLSSEQAHRVLELLTDKTTESMKLDALIDFLKNEVPDSTFKEDALKELYFLKDNLVLHKPDQIIQGWVPLPIEYEHNNEPVRVYLKNKNQKKESDDHTVLVALNTKRFGEVRCVVELIKKQFKLNFIVSTETIKKQFQTNETLLRNALKVIGREDALIRYKTKDEMTDEDAFEKPISIVERTNIDVRI